MLAPCRVRRIPQPGEIKSFAQVCSQRLGAEENRGNWYDRRRIDFDVQRRGAIRLQRIGHDKAEGRVRVHVHGTANLYTGICEIHNALKIHVTAAPELADIRN